MFLEQEQYLARIAALKDQMRETGEGLHMDDLERELSELKEEMAAEGFWDDLDRSTRVNQRIAAIERKISHYQELISACDDAEIMVQLADEENDADLVTEAGEFIDKLTQQVDALALETMMRGDYDNNNTVLSLHAGAGGTEAQDWAQMLYRMYTRYCERLGFKVTVLDMLPGDEAGIKSATFEVDGENAYGYLRSEKGVHRLVRISPFDSNARRHTSFVSLDVAPLLEDDGAVEIDMEDVRVDTYRSTGAGGQHVNKTDSAIRLTHQPTGIVVAVQSERSQHKNRAKAMSMLKAKIYEYEQDKKRRDLERFYGAKGEIAWGSQIRSYVLQPYTLAKDHRTGEENSNIQAVLDG
ncbi:MAG: peptide chain release factor 2, partial [Clostridiales bacterium]|nr:peptide chain release factor 2 [Clostridiales bacterium]